MRAEIVGVGTELLIGQIANTNARWMSERLAEIGVDVLYHQVVGDNLGRITEALSVALDRVDVVLVTGGLGPTGDDITREAIASVLKVSLVRHPELEEMLREKFKAFGTEMPVSNLKQADVPEGARYVMPARGTAPGLVCETRGGNRLYAMAGVPAEMREIMTGTVLPELAELSGPSTLRSRVVRCVGIGESAVAARLEDLFDKSLNPSLAYLAGSGEVKVRISAKAKTAKKAEELITPVVDEIVRRLGEVVFTTDDEELEHVVGRLLRSSGRTIACAESLTGGELGARLSSRPGSSETFVGSAVVYSSDAKRRVLGVSEETLKTVGAVSERCVREMASGARRVFGAAVAVAVSGAAGPEPHQGAEPGTVWIALDSEDVAYARVLHLTGDRERVNRWTQQAALDLVRRYLGGAGMPRPDGAA